MFRPRLEIALVLAAAALFGAMLGKHLSYPLLWADEAETAMFGRRVLEHGYPKVHGPRNVVYQFGPNIAVGVKEGLDAYIGTTWGHLYFAAPGLLWARGTADLYEKTFRVRLPFAVAGAAGVGLWLWALLPVFRGDPRRARRFAAVYLLLAALSLSLVLHLREVRYYALVVLLAGAIARVHLGYSVFGRVGFRRWAVELGLLLFLLFNTFFQAFFAFGALLGIDRLLAIRRGEAGWRDLAPLLGSAVLVAPLLLFFETFSTAAAFGEAFSLRFSGYVSNLGTIAAHFLRHEFLVPALVCRAAVAASGAGSPESRRVAARLLVFGAGYVAIGCLNPLALERYFVVLSPLVSGVFLLDAFALASALPARFAPARRRRAAAATVAALLALVLATRWPAFDALEGRLAELGTPYRGPLDYVIPYLAAGYAHPEELVIATNYEEYAFMYYLGSHVIIGLSLNNLVSDRELEPDVVVPRRRWPHSMQELGPFLRKGGYEVQRFPVRDLHFNNIPALSRSRFIPDPHRFRTAETDDPDEQLVIYLRSSSSKRTGTSSRP
jgi:hypothetical protein